MDTIGHGDDNGDEKKYFCLEDIKNPGTQKIIEKILTMDSVDNLDDDKKFYEIRSAGNGMIGRVSFFNKKN